MAARFFTFTGVTKVCCCGVAVSGFVLWELLSIFGQREHDPEKFTPYELRNGPAADREPELSYFVFAHWKEGADDNGRRDTPG